MPQIRVESVDSIKAMKVALIKFVETANAALGDAESDASRMLTWLEHDQASHWTNQLRKRHDHVEKCKEAVRMKQLYKDSSGSRQSAVEEEKALRVAIGRLEEARQKQANVKRSIPKLQRELQMYHGSVQRFATTVQVDLRTAGNKLEDLLRTLDAYIGYQPTETGSAAASTEATSALGIGDKPPSITRPPQTSPEASDIKTSKSGDSDTTQADTGEGKHGTA